MRQLTYINPLSPEAADTWRKAVAFKVPFLMGISYFFPVRLSITVTEFFLSPLALNKEWAKSRVINICASAGRSKIVCWVSPLICQWKMFSETYAVLEAEMGPLLLSSLGCKWRARTLSLFIAILKFRKSVFMLRCRCRNKQASQEKERNKRGT